MGRLLARLDGDAFDTATCGYLAILAACAPPATSGSHTGRSPLTGLTVDGKTLRGSRTNIATDHYRSHPADGLQLLDLAT